MSRMTWISLILLFLFVPKTPAADEFSSPMDFAERLREILLLDQRETFAELHLTYKYWSKEASKAPDYIRDIFEIDSDGRSMPSLMKDPNLKIYIRHGGEHRFDGSGCSTWSRFVIYFSTVPIGLLDELYAQKSDQLPEMWKRDFVETLVYRCGGDYRFIGTAFHSNAHRPWAGEYG